MTQEQMIESVKQHHPDVSEVQIRFWLNQAQKEFGRRSRVMEDTVTFNTVADQRYYSFSTISPLLEEVAELWFDGWNISRLHSRPSKRDSS
jgi:hypothetical protein|tara:strand:+ start:442 stop:714 length:273 start_codon:yes stop_codon:yes gene_type:complete